jgi:hypothetical protein
VSTNVVWEWADWDIGIDSSDGLFTNWKKQIDCISKVVLCKCSIANSVSSNFGTSDFVKVTLSDPAFINNLEHVI